MTAPWNLSLPETLAVGGKEIPIRTDYRVALDIFLALNDLELNDYNRTMEFVDILYVSEVPGAHLQEAINRGIWFLNGGENELEKNGPQLVAWEQDFNIIAAPISRIVGRDIRGIKYDPKTNAGGLHWWSFLSAYQSIGNCFFAQVVAIRDKKARNKPLDKQDREFYRRNRDLIDIKKPLTEAEQDILKEWM